MEFDIIPITLEELDGFSTIQLKLLRTAQQKKNELTTARDKDIELVKLMLLSNGTYASSLLSDKTAAITTDYQREIDVITEQLIFNLSLNEPSKDDELGGGSTGGETGYFVDYSMDYLQRYVVVRNYYLTIPDPHERLALYTADQVARRYLSGYYDTLYSYLQSFCN